VTLANGQITVRIALELGPNDEPPLPANSAWTDLTSRVRSYRDRRGRTDVLKPFQPGTADVVLDNGDRMLDPSNPDGLLFNGADEPIGLPLCPVQIGVMWNGTEYPKFYGVLGPEAWAGSIAPKGPSGTVTLSVMDALGHSPGLPQDTWGLIVSALQPEWLSRMDDTEFPVLDDGSHVPNSLTGAYGTVEGTTGISRPYYAIDYRSLGIMNPGLLLSGDHLVRFPAAELFPDGDEESFSVMCWWSANDEMTTGEATVLRMVHPFTGVNRWSITVDSADGHAYVTTFDAAETVVDTASIGTSRWDASLGKHLIVVVFDGAAEELTVWFGGYSETLACPALLYASDLLIGPSTVDVVFDEIATWRRKLDYINEIAPVFLGIVGLSYWAGHSFHERLGAWIEVTGRTPDADDTNEWHFPSGLPLSMWGLIRNRPKYDFGEPIMYGTVTLPANLADAFQQTVAYGGGARWATKENYLRARTIHSLTDSGFAAHYATPVTFTDEDATLGAGEYRHAGVEVTGLRIDRVINAAAVHFLYQEDEPPNISLASPMTCQARDWDSIQRYGLRIDETESEWAQWPLNQTLVELKVDRFKQPRQEIENLHLDPLGDDDLGEWLATTCELELACDVVYTPAGSDPITCAGLNIQQIEWNWTPERWTVDLMVAAS